jgi:hypothetical protein
MVVNAARLEPQVKQHACWYAIEAIVHFPEGCEV